MGLYKFRDEASRAHHMRGVARVRHVQLEQRVGNPVTLGSSAVVQSCTLVGSPAPVLTFAVALKAAYGTVSNTPMFS